MLRYQIPSHANKAEKVSPKTHDTIAITNAYDLLSICADALQTEYTDTPHPSIQSVKTLKDLAQPFFNRYKIQVLVRRNSVYYTFKSTANVDVFNVSVENKYYPNEATYHTLQLGLRPMTPHYIEREGRAFHHDNIPLKNYFYARIFLEKVVSIKSGTYKAHTTEYSRFYYLYRSLTPPDNLTQGSMDNATQNV